MKKVQHKYIRQEIMLQAYRLGLVPTPDTAIQIKIEYVKGFDWWDLIILVDKKFVKTHMIKKDFYKSLYELSDRIFIPALSTLLPND